MSKQIIADAQDRYFEHFGYDHGDDVYIFKLSTDNGTARLYARALDRAIARGERTNREDILEEIGDNVPIGAIV
jgi:arginyl-tRNA synthetase